MANENKNQSNNEAGQSDKNQLPTGKKEAEAAEGGSGSRAGWTVAVIAIILLVLVIIGGGILGYTYVEKTKKQYKEMSQDILKNIAPASDSNTSDNTPSALIEEGTVDSSTGNGTQSLDETESDKESKIVEPEEKEKVGSYNFDKKISELDQKVNASNEDFFQSDNYSESEMGF